jgi:hypothetical protein
MNKPEHRTQGNEDKAKSGGADLNLTRHGNIIRIPSPDNELDPPPGSAPTLSDVMTTTLAWTTDNLRRATMSIPLFQVDAFTGTPFKGNPAAVCLLPEPCGEAWMQAVAAEIESVRP